MLFTVAGGLLLAIAFGAGRMRLAVLLPVIRMLFAPLARALPAGLAVVRIVCQLGLVVGGTALPLAARITANGLCGLILRRKKRLKAVWTTPLDHRGVVALPRDSDLETELECLPRPRQWAPGWSHWHRLWLAKTAPFFTGTD